LFVFEFLAQKISKYNKSDFEFDETNFNERYVKFREQPLNLNLEIYPNPHSLKKNNLENKKYIFRTDEEGFILPTQHYNKPDYEIFFLGGSTMENRYVDEDLRFPFLIGQNLNKRCESKFKTYNLGRSKNNSIHSLNLLINKVLKYRPKYVVIMHNINDYIQFLYGNNFYWNDSDRQILSKNTNFKISNYIKSKVYDYIPITMILINSLRERFVLKSPRNKNNKNYIEANTSEYEDQYLKMIKTFYAISEIYEFDLVYLVQPHDITDLEYLDHLNNQNVFNNVLKSFVANIENDKRPTLIDLDAKFSNNSEIFYDDVHVNNYGSIEIANFITETFIKNYRLKGCE
jgi:hypothetical protein